MLAGWSWLGLAEAGWGWLGLAGWGRLQASPHLGSQGPALPLRLQLSGRKWGPCRSGSIRSHPINVSTRPSQGLSGPGWVRHSDAESLGRLSEQGAELVIGRPSPSLLCTSPASALVQAMANAMLSRPSLKPSVDPRCLWSTASTLSSPLTQLALPFSQQVFLSALKETGLYCSPTKQLLLIY